MKDLNRIKSLDRPTSCLGCAHNDVGAKTVGPLMMQQSVPYKSVCKNCYYWGAPEDTRVNYAILKRKSDSDPMRKIW